MGTDVQIDTVRFNTITSGTATSDTLTSDIVTDDNTGGGGDEHLTRPTFGVSHETFETVVEGGFKFNDQLFAINDNHHTPFDEQSVNIGEENSFSAS